MISTRSALAAALASTALSACAACGQSINIDFDDAPPNIGAGVPGILYGAAAAQPGVWNAIGTMFANTPSLALNSLSGAATPVTLTSLNINSIFGGAGNGAPTGNDLLLLGDVLNLGSEGSNDSFTFNNLLNGSYKVFVYAMAPDSSQFFTNVNINASAGTGMPGVQTVGGAYTGSFLAGITHAVFQNVAVSNGQMLINTDVPIGGGFGSLAGIQLVLVPAPGAMALLTAAVVIRVPSRRRR